MFPSRLVSVLGKPGLFNSYSLEFDGSNDKVTCGDISGFVANSGSISCWIKVTDSDSPSIQGIVTNGETGNTRNGIYIQTDKLYYNYGYDGGTNNVASDNDVTENVWIHFVVTREYAGGFTTIKMYLDGELQTDTDTSEVALSDAESAVIIGYLSSDRYFNGNIDEVAIWNTALSAGDISALYQARGTSDLNDDGNSANLKGWWRMGDGPLDDFNLIADQVNPTLGSELITDGDFPDGDNWAESGGWSINDTTEKAECDGDAAKLTQDGILTSGKVYKLSFEVGLLSGEGSITGNVTPRLGGVYGTSTPTVGIHTQYIRSGGTNMRFYGANPTKLTLDNVSVKEVQGNPGLMTNMASDDIVSDTP